VADFGEGALLTLVGMGELRIQSGFMRQRHEKRSLEFLSPAGRRAPVHEVADQGFEIRSAPLGTSALGPSRESWTALACGRKGANRISQARCVNAVP